MANCKEKINRMLELPNMPDDIRKIFEKFLEFSEEDLQIMMSKEYQEKIEKLDDISELTQKEGSVLIRFMEIDPFDKINEKNKQNKK